MAILVTCATGTVGSALVGLLAAKGAKVRAAVRSREQARALAPLGVPIVELDFSRTETIGPALAGVDALMLITPVDQRMNLMARAAIEAAKRAGVARIVRLSMLGAGTAQNRLARMHLGAERLLERSGVPSTILRSAPLMQGLLALDRIRDDGIIAVPAGAGRVAFIDARDVAAGAAQALTRPGHEGRTYELSGPEALGFDQVAETLATVMGRSVQYVPASEQQARAEMRGTQPWRAEATIELYRDYRDGVYGRVTGDVRRLTNAQPRSLAEFAADNVEALVLSPRFTGEPLDGSPAGT